MGKIVGQTGFFILAMGTCLREGISELKPVKLRLKTDLESRPTRAEGLVNTYISWPINVSTTKIHGFYWHNIQHWFSCHIEWKAFSIFLPPSFGLVPHEANLSVYIFHFLSFSSFDLLYISPHSLHWYFFAHIWYFPVQIIYYEPFKTPVV